MASRSCIWRSATSSWSGGFPTAPWKPRDVVGDQFGGGALGLRGYGSEHVWTCPHTLGVKGFLDGDLRLVGSLHANVEFLAAPAPVPHHIAIDLPSVRWLTLQDGAQLLVAEGALSSSCTSRSR